MRFALLGDHPDGLEMACALVESGRHELAAYTAPPGDEMLRRWGPGAQRVGDLEEVLADPAVEAVIVAGGPAVRPAQLRRALESERHVLCVFPPDQTPEIAYQAEMIQKDTHRVLFPLAPEGLHPAVVRLAEFVRRPGDAADGAAPLGAFRLLEAERAVPGEVLDGVAEPGRKPSFPGWDLLRVLGGEIAELSAFAEREALEPGETVLVNGRFERGGLFQWTLLPRRPEAQWRLAVVGERGRAELVFPLGWDGPAYLDWCDPAGEPRAESWGRWDPWPVLVERFEAAVAAGGRPRAEGPSWQDAVRALELDDAARRAVERRRSSVLEYQEASEEVGFKGTMTLAGCALLWAVLLLLVASRFVPALGWLMIPLLAGFLGLQLLRYILPAKKK